MAKTGAFWDTNPMNFGDVVHAQVRKLTRNSAIAIHKYCVDYSPVDSGAYRASWNISEGSPEYKWVGRQNHWSSPLPEPAVPKLSTLFYRTFYVTNGAPYALLLEQGHSDQAPMGVMREALKWAKWN